MTAVTAGPVPGPAAVNSLFEQTIGWGLVVAVAALVLSAAGWAMGSAGQNPAVAGRAKTGMAVALAGALLLGGAKTYLEWLYNDQSGSFAGNPADYQITATTTAPTFAVIDRTADWNTDLTRLRAAQHLPPFGTDPALDQLATACATSLAGGPGRCPVDAQYQRWDIPPGQVAQLSGGLTSTAVKQADLNLLGDFSPIGGDVRLAWVAVRNTASEKTVLVLMISDGPCAGRCVINSDGVAAGLLLHVTD